jgi:hypothetical protein
MAHSSDQASAFPKRREAHPQRSRDGGEMIANVYHLAAELQQRLGVRSSPGHREAGTRLSAKLAQGEP